MKLDFDILVLGHLIPQNMEKEVFDKTKGYINFSSSSHLRLMLDCIKEGFLGEIRLFNLLPVPSFPKRYKDLWIPSFDFEIDGCIKAKNVGYFNLTVLKKLSKRARVLKNAIKWAKENTGRKKILFAYGVYSEYLDTFKAIKKIDKNIHINLIVPDIPLYTDIDKKESLIYKLRAKYRMNKMEKNSSYVDSFVFLTQNMKDFFKTQKPYEVIEGVFSQNPYVGEYKPGSIKTITYTGTFTVKYGVLDLVKAFSYIKDENYRLVLAGSGEGEEEIKQAAKEDERIIYLGALTKDEVLRLQANSTILVNPRKDEHDFTKYSFPSKIMEYLSSGRPVICHKLPGIPDEYDDYLYYFKSKDPQGMAVDLMELCAFNENALKIFGLAGRDFVFANKNTKVQGEKLKSMVLDYGRIKV